jgi:hypothetical protein
MLEVGVSLIIGLVVLFVISPIIIGVLFLIETIADMLWRR